MKKFLRLDWDAIAGIVAAMAAIIMHFLHLIEEDILLTIAVVLIALLFIRDLRRERLAERIGESVQQTKDTVKTIQANLLPPDAILVGPRRLHAVCERFSARARGEMVWFNVCLLMFKPQSLFDTLLRPAIESPLVSSIQFVLEKGQQNLWDSEIVPKVAACRGKEKVKEPLWTTAKDNISLIISDTDSDGMTECLLSFWGEPFMAKAEGQNIPRYVFHVQSQSELVGRLVDLVRSSTVSA